MLLFTIRSRHVLPDLCSAPIGLYYEVGNGIMFKVSLVISPEHVPLHGIVLVLELLG